MKLTKAPREALRVLQGKGSRTYAHPSWIPECMWELAEYGLASVDVPDTGPCSVVLTDAGREALKGEKL